MQDAILVHLVPLNQMTGHAVGVVVRLLARPVDWLTGIVLVIPLLGNVCHVSQGVREVVQDPPSHRLLLARRAVSSQLAHYRPQYV